MSKKTKMSVDEVLERAKRFFDGNFGLTLSNHESQCCLEFAGKLGFVTLAIEESDETTEVIVRTREWEYQVKDFLRNLK
ncbi:MAG: hypothetical protein ACXAAN_15465 [Candidatus Thorarchaeota archaeon]